MVPHGKAGTRAKREFAAVHGTSPPQSAAAALPRLCCAQVVTRSKYDGTRLEQLLENFLGGGSLTDPEPAAKSTAATAAAAHESGRANSAPTSAAAAPDTPHTRRSISALARGADAKDGLVDLGGASPADLPPLQERPPAVASQTAPVQSSFVLPRLVHPFDCVTSLSRICGQYCFRLCRSVRGGAA